MAVLWVFEFDVVEDGGDDAACDDDGDCTQIDTHLLCFSASRA